MKLWLVLTIIGMSHSSSFDFTRMTGGMGTLAGCQERASHIQEDLRKSTEWLKQMNTNEEDVSVTCVQSDTQPK